MKNANRPYIPNKKRRDGGGKILVTLAIYQSRDHVRLFYRFLAENQGPKSTKCVQFSLFKIFPIMWSSKFSVRKLTRSCLFSLETSMQSLEIHIILSLVTRKLNKIAFSAIKLEKTAQSSLCWIWIRAQWLSKEIATFHFLKAINLFD